MDLHVCAKDLLRLCTSGVDCKFGHLIRDSGEHNSCLLKTFRVDTLDEHNLRRLVIIKSDYLYTSEGATTPSSQSSSTGGQLVDNNKSLELPTSVSVKDTVPMKYEYICETYTWTVRVPTPQTVLITTRSSALLVADCGDEEWFSIRGIEHMDFNTMSAISDGTTFKLKRLSTPSYVTATPGTPLNFYTQWVWYRQERDGTYPPFYPKLQYTLEEKYLKGQHKYYFEFEDLRLMVDTHSLPMTQTNLHTQGCTLICRRPVFEPTKKLEVPKMSSLLLAEVPSVVHQVPKHWSAVDHFQDFELVELESADPEYITVQRQFFSTMSMTEQNAKRAMTPRGQRPEEVDERQLFHGTPTLQAARGICANSFDFRRSGENVGAIHGKGAYFSTTAKYSHSYTRVHTTVRGDSLRFMFLGRILVGQYTLGNASYTKPPERDRLKLYDSCVNNVSNPSIFVIFDLAQSYPENLFLVYSIPFCVYIKESLFELYIFRAAPDIIIFRTTPYFYIYRAILYSTSTGSLPNPTPSKPLPTSTSTGQLLVLHFQDHSLFLHLQDHSYYFLFKTTHYLYIYSTTPYFYIFRTNPCYFLFKTTPYLYSYRNIPYLYINRTTPYFYIYRNIIYVYIFRITPWYYIFRIGHYFSIFRTTPCCFLFKTIPYLYIYRTTPFFYVFRTSHYFYIYRNILYFYIYTPFFHIFWTTLCSLLFKTTPYFYIFRTTPFFYIYSITPYFYIFRTTPCYFLFKTTPYFYIFRITP
ncbi:hypothetical protein C0Q70_02498 [Pomacea canaliculata]|uniref:Poly [ADP-ribose] polymerase n=1 Tax=Pomacea canaliculata TaxID=400727 RepID=A0A2T7PQ47_POMCA|nr:hypothetical protein C0Q70_02498 [Pomacea canaliculata]